MLPEEWPVVADNAKRDATPRGRGGARLRDRLAVVRIDFFLDPELRLNEQERALMTAMLDALVNEVADALRAELPGESIAANSDYSERVADRLRNAGLLDDRDLIALLLRRAEEERMCMLARGRSGRRDTRLLQTLISHDNGPVAAAAMALVLARGRRRDSLGQGLVSLDDLSRPAALRLVQRVAAAIQPEVSEGRGGGAVDRALGEAVARVIARHDPERSLETLSANLAAMLDSTGELDDQLLLAASAEGEMGFIAQVLARRSGLKSKRVLDALLGGNADSIAALLRASGASRDFAAGLIAISGDMIGLDRPERLIECFDSLGSDAVADVISELSADGDYRQALAALDSVRG